MNKQKRIDLLFTLSILLIITVNIACAIIRDSLPYTTHSYNDYLEKHIVDGFSGSTTTYPVNSTVLIISAIVILALILIRRKLIPTIVGIIAIISLAFFPISAGTRSGGIAGRTENYTCSLLTCHYY